MGWPSLRCPPAAIDPCRSSSSTRTCRRPTATRAPCGSCRILELLVADGHRVTLIARRGLDDERAALALERLGIEVHRADPQRLPEAQRALLADAPPLDVEALLARVRPDVAWLSFYEIAEAYLPLLRRHAPGARIVVDTVDVHSVREQRAADLSGRREDHERARRHAGARAGGVRAPPTRWWP